MRVSIMSCSSKSWQGQITNTQEPVLQYNKLYVDIGIACKHRPATRNGCVALEYSCTDNATVKSCWVVHPKEAGRGINVKIIETD